MIFLTFRCSLETAKINVPVKPIEKCSDSSDWSKISGFLAFLLLLESKLHFHITDGEHDWDIYILKSQAETVSPQEVLGVKGWCSAAE